MSRDDSISEEDDLRKILLVGAISFGYDKGNSISAGVDISRRLRKYVRPLDFLIGYHRGWVHVDFVGVRITL